MCITFDKTFPSVPIVFTLTVTFDLYFENVNLNHNFVTVTDSALIFHMCFPSDKTFPAVPNIVTLMLPSGDISVSQTHLVSRL